MVKSTDCLCAMFIFYVSVKTWVLVLYFCIYFAYFSICLSEYVISWIYLLCTCIVHRVFVDAKFFNHEGVLVLHVSWTKVCITKQTSWCLRWASDLLRMVSTILSSTTRARSLQWWRFGRKGFGCWRSCDPEEDAGKAKGWSKQSRQLQANQSRSRV